MVFTNHFALFLLFFSYKRIVGKTTNGSLRMAFLDNAQHFVFLLVYKRKELHEKKNNKSHGSCIKGSKWIPTIEKLCLDKM